MLLLLALSLEGILSSWFLLMRYHLHRQMISLSKIHRTLRVVQFLQPVLVVWPPVSTEFPSLAVSVSLQVASFLRFATSTFQASDVLFSYLLA